MRPQFLPTHGCTPDQKLMDDLLTTIISLRDPNVAATVHYYRFWPFSVTIAGFMTFTAEVRQDMNFGFARMRNTFVSRGIPMYAGETGLLACDLRLQPTERHRTW